MITDEGDEVGRHLGGRYQQDLGRKADRRR